MSKAVAKAMENGIYPEMKKVEAASIYAVTGDLRKVSELTGVEESLLKYWRKQEWFQLVLKEVWSENNETLNAKLTAAIDKAQDQLLDRLEHGDTKMTRDGELVRVPIPGKDLSLITAIVFDKRQVLRGEPTSRSESVQIGDKQLTRLEQLALTFENLANHRRAKTDVVDAEVITEDAKPQPTGT